MSKPKSVTLMMPDGETIRLYLGDNLAIKIDLDVVKSDQNISGYIKWDTDVKVIDIR